MMKLLATGDVRPAPANFPESHLVLPSPIFCLRLTPERPECPNGTVLRRHRRASHRTPVTPAPLAPSFVGPVRAASRPRLGLSGCEETAERGIKEAQMGRAEAARIEADFTGTDCQLATFTGRVVLTKG